MEVKIVTMRLALAVAVIAVAVFWARRVHERRPSLGQVEPAPLSALIALPQSRLAILDLGQMNILCAEGLPSIGILDWNSQLQILTNWAARISAETRRHWYRFERNPAEFNRSEGYFRMLMMSVVLAEDFRIQYDPARQTNFRTATPHDGFFASPDSVFLTGLLGEKRKGTCSSLPVLYVALGRRLGYPLHLVTTKGHLFVRWDGKGERFNIEATAHGLNTFEDDYYRRWPFPVTAEVSRTFLTSYFWPKCEIATRCRRRG